MMHRILPISARPCRFAGFLLSFLCMVSANGCGRHATDLQIESFQTVPSQTYSEQFENGFYAVDSNSNWDLVFEVPPTWREPSSQPTSAPADQPAQEWTSQLLYIKIFWTPNPGRTYAESTQTNCSISYYLLTGRKIMCYEGTGFAYFRPPKAGKPFIGRLESASLHPADHSEGAYDLFGLCRLKGSFVAANDMAKVANSLLTIRRRTASIQASRQ